MEIPCIALLTQVALRWRAANTHSILACETRQSRKSGIALRHIKRAYFASEITDFCKKIMMNISQRLNTSYRECAQKYLWNVYVP